MSYPAHTDEVQVLQETNGFNILFIHSSLDDAGLTPQEFRLFAHLSRRAGERVAFAAADSMAKACRMHRDTVWTALKELERRRMICREKRAGQTTLIRLTSPSHWNLNPAETEGHPVLRADPYFPLPPGGNGGPTLAETEGHEGNPLRVSKEDNPKISREVASAESGRGKTFDLEAPHAKRASEPAPCSAKSPIPTVLDTPEFRAAWADWEQHRKERRKPLTPTSRRVQLAKLSEMGLASALAALRHSTASGYQGIFEPGTSHAPTPHAKPHRNDFIAGAGTGPSTTEILRRRAEREAAERLSAAQQPVAG